ncbi:UN93A-like protein [Mya arenaria]|uniref:UN93A-like protein n=1 Tax=Mya arenaria TaxID=6604 RepID=A0ABY7G2F2_MYAAR|nr:UN93A-like protein [Mya arenaria]
MRRRAFLFFEGTTVCFKMNDIVVDHVRMMITHKTFRLLVPLLVFCGLQQAFVFADFTQAFVSCTIGEEYIGYCMIILGLANIVSAILVALCANLIPREVVFGIGGILHMGLMIGLLIWIPDKKLSIFFLMAASWGVCDAVWQTQCNNMAFANYRLLQSFGLAMGFVGGTFMTVSFKLYILMILLVVAIMFYVLAEYRLKQVDADIFEGQIEVN